MTKARPRATTKGRQGRPVVVVPSAIVVVAVLVLASVLLLAIVCCAQQEVPERENGPANLREGKRLFQQGLYSSAATLFWNAVLSHHQHSSHYTVEDAFGHFLQCYAIQGKAIDAYLFIAKESLRRGQLGMAGTYIQQAISTDNTNQEAIHLNRILAQSAGDVNKAYYLLAQLQSGGGDGHIQRTNGEESAETLYNKGTRYFAEKQYSKAVQVFDKSCALAKGNMIFNGACTNAVYCRANIMDWGTLGLQFVEDMETVATITQLEVEQWRTQLDGKKVQWRRPTSVHPHMMLGFPVDSMLKTYVAESFATMDEPLARYDSKMSLPPDLPYNSTLLRENFLSEERAHDEKLRIGFVASAFNSKAVLYLSQDMFRFFDAEHFEIHVFSLGPPDNEQFITHAMRGVDWRRRVMNNVDHFHDLQHLQKNHVELARYIHERAKIHILIEWDGYARQGSRAQGLFALRPAPVQILHQEFLGTMGGDYVDYIITDPITSPIHLEHLYVEKFLYLPHHFFSKGHALQKEVKDPTYHYTPKPQNNRYMLGTGSPQENKCLSDVVDNDVSFVYCNFNKFLKNNPETVQSWMQILRQVPNSILCLLENPREGIPNLRRYVNEFFPDEAFNERIHFLPWEANPFDHQMRNQDFCNVILDSHPYNGHTTAQDALYGGVPIVTRSDGDDMSSRVTTSANIVLGLPELNAWNGVSQYQDIAIRLGRNVTLYDEIRTRLIRTCLQRNPMHPYWDVPRYVKNFERGMTMAWETYLLGNDNNSKHHIRVTEDNDRHGTMEVDIERMDNIKLHRRTEGEKTFWNVKEEMTEL